MNVASWKHELQNIRCRIAMCSAPTWCSCCPRPAQRPDRRLTNTRREIVSKWRKRFFEQRLEGLEERDRSGRSRLFPP